MKLEKLVKDLDIIEKINFFNHEIKCITHQSNECDKQGLFFCIKGDNFDGHNFANEAINNGCVVCVCEKKLEKVDVTQIIVPDVRLAMSIIAKEFFERACDSLKIISIVGTNGKTTTSHILAKMLKDCGKKVGVIGTNGVFVGEICLPNNLTTPDPIELHYTFKQFLSFGVEYAIIEASAHAIKLNKLFGVFSRVGIFTNISAEHLDFFNSMDNYAQTKLDFFNNQNMECAVINTDDAYGRRLLISTNVPAKSYGICSPSNTFAIDIKTSLQGSEFVVNLADDVFKITTKLVGDYNVYNILGAITCAHILGCSNEIIKTSLHTLESIPGRLNVFEKEENIKIIIDYAHTPDGIEKTLKLIKLLRRGRIITLFGVVGYANNLKRREMGQAVSKFSDVVIITTDNSCDEDFSTIAHDIKKGIAKEKSTMEIEDRKKAIYFGFDMLQKNDTFVLLGKGAETYQKIKSKKVSHSDIDVINELLK